MGEHGCHPTHMAHAVHSCAQAHLHRGTPPQPYSSSILSILKQSLSLDPLSELLKYHIQSSSTTISTTLSRPVKQGTYVKRIQLVFTSTFMCLHAPITNKTMLLNWALFDQFLVSQLPVYEPSEAEIADPLLYAENVRKYMVRLAQFACPRILSQND